MFEKLKSKEFEVQALHHAAAILRHDMREAAGELEEILLSFAIPIEELVYGGGGEGRGTQRLRKALVAKGWLKHTFEVKKSVDGEVRESASHIVDHVKIFRGNTIALEIEWNNKDPFFDRDLENFKRLHADAAISVGVIITRGRSLQEALRGLIEQFARDKGVSSLLKASKFYTPTPRQKERIEKDALTKGSFEKGWANAFVADKFGEATTHWKKLEERVARGVGNPCPLLLIGIPRGVISI
jgi:hypothetical protein